MSDDEVIEGALVPAPAAEIRYEDENPDTVARVFVRVEYADGRIREYEAREPQDFALTDPADLRTMTLRTTGLRVFAGEGFHGIQAMAPTLRLSFAANPRYNMEIRTEATAASSSGRATQGG